MVEQQINADPLGAPSIWVRLPVFFGIVWLTGFVGLVTSPGGSVQTFGTQVEDVLFGFFTFPGGAAFALGGSVHSAVVFLLALAVFYIGSLFLLYYYFTTRDLGVWLLLSFLLVVECGLALLGQSVFVENMKNWT